MVLSSAILCKPLQIPSCPYPGIRSIFAKSHSLLHNGQTLRVFNQRWMQSRWKTWPQFPKAIDRPLSLVGEGLAWYSIDGSFKELRQMAHYQWTNERRTICKSYNACPTREAKKKGAQHLHAKYLPCLHKYPMTTWLQHSISWFQILEELLLSWPRPWQQVCKPVKQKRERERKWQVWNEWRFDDAILFVCCHYTKLTASAICVSAIVSIEYSVIVWRM